MRSLIAVVVLASGLTGCSAIAGMEQSQGPKPAPSEWQSPAAELGTTPSPAPAAQSPSPTSSCQHYPAPSLGPAEAEPPPWGPAFYPEILDTGTVASVAEIDQTGFEIRVPALHLKDASVETVLRIDEGDHIETRIYLTREPIVEGDTLVDVLAAGGVLVTQRPTIGIDAQAVIDELGELAVVVPLGATQAALTWGDPIGQKVRPFGLYWSESGYDLAMISGLDNADDTMLLAESIYCN